MTTVIGLWGILATAWAADDLGDRVRALEQACDLDTLQAVVTYETGRPGVSDQTREWLARVQARVLFYRRTDELGDAGQAREALEAASTSWDAEKPGFAGAWRRSRQAWVEAIEAIEAENVDGALAAAERFESSSMFDCDPVRLHGLRTAIALADLMRGLRSADQEGDLAAAVKLSDAIRAFPGVSQSARAYADEIDPRRQVDEALEVEAYKEAASDLGRLAAAIASPEPEVKHWLESRAYRARIGLARAIGDEAQALRALRWYTRLEGNDDEDRAWIAAHRAAPTGDGWVFRGHLSLTTGGQWRFGEFDQGTAVAAGGIVSFEALAPACGQVVVSMRSPDLLLRYGAPSPGGLAPPLVEGVLGFGCTLPVKAPQLGRLSLRLHAVGALLPTRGTIRDDFLMFAGSPELGLYADLFDERLRIGAAGGTSWVLSSARLGISGVLWERKITRLRLGLDAGYLRGRPTSSEELLDVDWLWAGLSLGVELRAPSR